MRLKEYGGTQDHPEVWWPPNVPGHEEIYNEESSAHFDVIESARFNSTLVRDIN